MTVVLRRSEIRRALDVGACVEALRDAFVSYATARMLPMQRVAAPLHEAGSAMVMLPGVTPGIPAYSVKVHAKFPRSAEAIQGTILLHDLATGDLLAILESGYLTAVRTGAVAALATDALARPSAGRVAVIGAGIQGRCQLESLSRLRPITGGRVYDVEPAAAAAYAREMSARLGVALEVSSSAAAAAADAEIVLVATWARAPILGAADVAPGAHVTSLGADQRGKRELDAALLERAYLVCDDRALTMEMGAVGNAGLPEAVIDAELGDVLAGRAPGRRTDAEITVFTAVGLAFQDVVVAWRALADARAQGLALLEVDLRA